MRVSLGIRYHSLASSGLGLQYTSQLFTRGWKVDDASDRKLLVMYDIYNDSIEPLQCVFRPISQ